MKKLYRGLLLPLLVLVLLTGCGKPSIETPTPTPPTGSIAPTPSASPTNAPTDEPGVKLVLIQDPAQMGAVKLMSDHRDSIKDYQFTIVNSSQEAMDLLSSGEADIAALAANLAPALYEESQKQMQVIAIHTLGALYLLENGTEVDTLADLRGKTIYAPEQGTDAGYILEYALKQNGLALGRDVFLQYMNFVQLEQQIAAGTIGLSMLSLPAAASLQQQNTALRLALDLTIEWEIATEGQAFVMGCLVARKGFIDENPDDLATFLAAYADSVDYATNHWEETAALASELGLVPNADAAMTALPRCNLVCITGLEMRERLQGYYETLYAANTGAILGIPDGKFFFTP